MVALRLWRPSVCPSMPDDSCTVHAELATHSRARARQLVTNQRHYLLPAPCAIYRSLVVIARRRFARIHRCPERRFVHGTKEGGAAWAGLRCAALQTCRSKGSPYSITERKVPELISVLGSQPAGDVSHKPGGRLPLLSTRPAVTLATLKTAAISFAAWCTEAQWV